MYLKHFGLEHRPFSITPDPRFLYLSDRYREGLAHLLFGVGENGGFVLLTGEVGTGKTTLCRGLLEQLPDNVDAALIINPKLSPDELLETLCDEIGVTRDGGEAPRTKTLIDALNRHLLANHAAGRRTVLIIDEAQNLGTDALEQVRLLTNLETATEKLLQIILIGQPELRELLARRELRQLGQRITARYHLEPMTRDEVASYIGHRLTLAGADRSCFTPAARRRVHALTGGIPRLVNTVCDRALLGAYSRGRHRVDWFTVGQSAREVLSGSGATTTRRIGAVTAVVALALGGWLGAESYRSEPGEAPSPPATASDPAASGSAAQEREPATAERIEVASAPGDAVAMSEELLLPLLAADDALRRLATLWGLSLPDGQATCDALAARGWSCFDGRLSWAALRQLDRPAVLELAADRDDPRSGFVVLEAIERDQPRLTGDGEPVRAPLARLGNRWFGQVTVIWQPPADRKLLRPGQRDPLVPWLRDRLAGFDQERAATNDPLQYDAALKRRVIRFQADRALNPDGLVGERTLLELSSLEASGPRLSPAVGG